MVPRGPPKHAWYVALACVGSLRCQSGSCLVRRRQIWVWLTSSMECRTGPRGQRMPAGTHGSKSGGMSPMTMALLGLLAFKAVKSLMGG